MARPWRRVLIGLSIKIGISIRELEQLDIATIRQYLAMMGELNKPKKTAPANMAPQTEAEMIASVSAALGMRK